jgi:hypothetical protein
MSWGIVAVAGASLVGGIYSSNQQGKAADRAAGAQSAAAEAGIEEQRRQFDAIQKLLQPYVQAGTGALTGQQDLLGLNGQGAQGAAIAGLEGSPQFAALMQQGENAILANASATGGLRGGNTQAALAQYRPALLSQLIEQQYGRLGGLTSIGQNAAAGVGNAGMQTGTNVSNLLQQQGAAQAGGYLAQGRTQAGYANAITGAIGQYYGLGGRFGGSGSAFTANDPTGYGMTRPGIDLPTRGGM